MGRIGQIDRYSNTMVHPFLLYYISLMKQHLLIDHSLTHPGDAELCREIKRRVDFILGVDFGKVELVGQSVPQTADTVVFNVIFL